jgi:hypothetical protein
MKFDTRHFTWFKQRLELGFDSRELWGLDYTIAKFVLPRLIEFRKISDKTCPSSLLGNKVKYTKNDFHNGRKKWKRALDNMVFAFAYIIFDNGSDKDIALVEFFGVEIDKDNWAKNEKRCQKGLEQFGKYFRALWD